MSQLIVSTSAGNSVRVFMTASCAGVSRQRAGVGRGFSRVFLIDLGLLGDGTDSDDNVCAGVRLVSLLFLFPLRAGALAASPGNSSFLPPRDTATSVPTVSTLTRFEQRAGDGSRPSPDSWSLLARLLWSSSLNKLPKGPAERC